MEFAGRSVVIAGVGRAGQVGESVAEAFAERGARVFLVSRDGSDAQARAEPLLARGLRAAALSADLGDPTATVALADRVRDATGGRLHALVHLAGGFTPSGAVAESDPAVWATQFARNATTAYLTARAFMPILRNGSGSIVFFASEAVLPGGRVAGVAAYAAAKSAVVALMQCIAQEEAAHGVRANALAPAAIRTAANLASMGPDAHLVAREEVANTVLMLCSDLARRMTGLVVPVR